MARVLRTACCILMAAIVADSRALAQGKDPSNLDDRGQYFPKVYHTPVLSSATTVPGDDDGSKTANWLSLEETLLPGLRSRLFRSLKFSASYLDQVDCVEDAKKNLGEFGLCTVVEPQDPSGDDRTFRFNPDDHLFSFEGTIKPGRWFRSADDFSKAYALAKDASKYVDVDQDPLGSMNRPLEKLHHLTWGPGKRFLSALSVTAKYVERTKLQENDVVTGEVRGDDEFDESLTVEFDPSRLLVFPEELAAAYKALEGHTKLRKANLSGLNVDECKEKNGGVDCIAELCRTTLRSDLLDCLETLSRTPVRARWLSAMMPTVKFERKEQFDFLRDGGGTFVERPFLDDSLEVLTVTWDLGTTLDTAEHRRDALTAIMTHQKLVHQDHMRARGGQGITIQPPATTVQGGQSLSEPLFAVYDDNQELVDASWTATWVVSDKVKRDVSALGLRVNGKPGVLRGIPKACGKPGVLLGTPEACGQPYKIRLTAKDDFGNVAMLDYHLTVTAPR